MGGFSLKTPYACKLKITIIIYHNFIKEPWITPDRATPKSCYPCRTNLKKIQTNNNNNDKLKKNEKNNPHIPKQIQKNSQKNNKEKMKKQNNRPKRNNIILKHQTK